MIQKAPSSLWTTPLQYLQIVYKYEILYIFSYLKCLRHLKGCAWVMQVSLLRGIWRVIICCAVDVSDLNLLSPLPHHSPCTEPSLPLSTFICPLDQLWNGPMIKLEGNFSTNKLSGKVSDMVDLFFQICKQNVGFMSCLWFYFYNFISCIKLSSCSLRGLSERITLMSVWDKKNVPLVWEKWKSPVELSVFFFFKMPLPAVLILHWM